MADLLVNLRIRAFETVTAVARKVSGELGKIAKLGEETRDKLEKNSGLALTAQQLGAFGAQLRSAGAAITAPFLAGADAFDDLEDSIAMVGVRSGATGEQVAQMLETASSLGRTTSISSQEVAQGFDALASSGLSAADQLKAVGPALQLASVSGLEMGAASQLAGSLVKRFGLDAAELPRLLDVVAGTSRAANVSLSDMATAMAAAAPNASRFGVGVNDVAALAGALGQAGFRGEQAGQTISDIIVKLGAAKKLGAKGLQILGINTTDKATGQLKSLPVLLGEINAKTSQMGAARREKFLEGIFGPESAKNVGKLLSSLKGGELQAFADQAARSGGALGTMFQGSEASKESERLMNSLKGLGEALGKPLAGPLESLKNFVTRLTVSFTAWTEKHPKLTKVIAFTVVGVGALLAALGALIGLMSGALLVVLTALSVGPLLTLIGGFSGLAGIFLGPLKAGIMVVLGPLKALAVSMWAALAPAIAAAAPFLAMAAAIGAVSLAIAQLVKHWEKLNFLEGLDGIWESLKDDGILSTIGQTLDPRTLLKDIGVMGSEPAPIQPGAAVAAGGATSVGGTIKIQVEGAAKVKSVQETGPVGLDVDAGLAMTGP